MGVLDAVRLSPGADVAAVTTAQLRALVERLLAAGQWSDGDPEIMVVLDAGYDAPRIGRVTAAALAYIRWWRVVIVGGSQ